MSAHATDLRTGDAFWPLRDGLLAAYPPLARDERCQVAIVGGGITGALAAYRLSEAGCDVVVVDRHDAGFGSTAASTGLLLHETDLPLTDLSAKVGSDGAVRAWRLGLDAVTQIETLCAQLGDCGFTRQPTVYFASSRWDVRCLQAEYQRRRDMGFDVAWLSRSDMNRQWGFAAPGAIRSGGNAQVDPYRLTHRLLAAAQQRGARVYDRTTVTEVRTDGAGVTLDTDRGSTVRASRLIVAAGYDVDRQLGKKAGTMNSTWVVVTEPATDLSWWPQRALLWETRRPYLYMRTTEDSRVIIGGEDEPWASRHEDPRLLRKKATALLNRFSDLFPTSNLEVAYAWAGVFGSTADGLPYIGGRPDQPRTWFALGYGGNGITFSVIAANLMRDWWSRRPNEDGPLFSFDRSSTKVATLGRFLAAQR